MDWRVALVVAAAGYLVGSISFARLVVRLARPGSSVARIEVPLASGDVFVSDMVSATAVRVALGPRYGLLTAALDMAKAAVPTLALRLWAPDEPYFLIVAAAVVAGHNLPVFHGFRGGRGESPMYGGLLVIDPLAAVGTTLIGALVGFLVGNILVLRWAGMVLLVPWLWVATGSPWYLAYAVFVVGAYFVALRPELAQYARLLREGRDPTNEEIAGVFAMGRRLGRAIDRHAPLPALVRRIRGPAGAE